MKIADLKEVCELISTDNRINDMSINDEGHFIGIDSGKTLIVDVNYANHDLPYNINISNVTGLIQLLNRFDNDSDCNIFDGKLRVSMGDRFTTTPLSAIELPKFNLPKLTNDDYDIIVNKIDSKLLNVTSTLRPTAIVNEYYAIFVVDNKLMIHIGDDSGTVIGDKIVDINPENGDKFDSSKIAKYSKNVAECFKTVNGEISIKIVTDKIMIVESITEKYRAIYNLAPRVD
jgi:hypothetical protein